jgi:hypothetical protein
MKAAFCNPVPPSEPGPPFGRPLFLERHSFSLLWFVYADRAKDRDNLM